MSGRRHISLEKKQEKEHNYIFILYLCKSWLKKNVSNKLV